MILLSIVSFSLTGEFSRARDVSEREAEVSEVLVAAVVHRGQVLPLLNGAGQVHRVQRELQLAFNEKVKLNGWIGFILLLHCKFKLYCSSTSLFALSFPNLPSFHCPPICTEIGYKVVPRFRESRLLVPSGRGGPSSRNLGPIF